MAFAPSDLVLKDKFKNVHWCATSNTQEGYGRELHHCGSITLQLVGKRYVVICDYTCLSIFVASQLKKPNVMPKDVEKFMRENLTDEVLKLMKTLGIQLWHGVVQGPAALLIPTGSWIMEKNLGTVAYLLKATIVPNSITGAMAFHHIMKDIVACWPQQLGFRFCIMWLLLLHVFFHVRSIGRFKESATQQFKTKQLKFRLTGFGPSRLLATMGKLLRTRVFKDSRRSRRL